MARAGRVALAVASLLAAARADPAACQQVAGRAGTERGQAAATITGQVVELGTNQPVPEAEVRLSGMPAPQITDAGGGFRFEGVAAGLHRLTVRHIAYGTTSDTLTVMPGQHVSVRFQVGSSAIPLRPLVVTARSDASERWWFHAQSILGRLLDARSGQPVPYGFVTLISPAGDTLETVVSDSTGRFRMMPPDSAHYRLRATAVGYAPSLSPPVALARQQQLEVELQMGPTPFELDPLTVVARRDWDWWRGVEPARKWGFWERREHYASWGMGRFFTHQDIIKWPSVTTILLEYGRPIPMPQCSSGRPAIYIDGKPALQDPNTLWAKLGPGSWLPINDADVDDIEIYHTSADMPPEIFAEYGSSCGAVLIWTK